jgi:hypothetical protein
MSDRDKWIKLDELRQPGMRRILDAMKQIEKEAPGLLDEALSASIDFAKCSDSGHVPQ